MSETYTKGPYYMNPPLSVETTIVTGTKHDQGKPPLELIPTQALMEIAKVLEFGRRKYAADNWRGGFAWRRLIGAALRHLYAFSGGEDRDPESGISHLAHAGCCILFLLEHYLVGLGTDDRYQYQIRKEDTAK